MGAKTWMLVYSESGARDALKNAHQLDRDATTKLVHGLFPGETLEPLEDGTLAWTCPPNKEICIGCYSGVSIVAAKEFGIDNPSRIPKRFVDSAGSGAATLHAMHSVVDWFAFACWQNGSLIRSLSVSPDDGMIEDIGERMAFEEPFWTGKHPVNADDEEENDYPLPFHPLELGEEALKEFFGYQLEGIVDPSLLEPEEVALMRFKRKRPFWKFW
jgi:hypothetical protein